MYEIAESGRVAGLCLWLFHSFFVLKFKDFLIKYINNDVPVIKKLLIVYLSNKKLKIDV